MGLPTGSGSPAAAQHVSDQQTKGDGDPGHQEKELHVPRADALGSERVSQRESAEDCNEVAHENNHTGGKPRAIQGAGRFYSGALL